jgi:octaprenyl-diphosphate synthase
VLNRNLEIVDIISHLGQNLTEGELSQFAIANEAIIDEDEYFNVIDKKTASLLAACAKVGALTSGAIVIL